MSDFPTLGYKHVVKGSWYQQIRENMASSQRLVDKMSLAQVMKMYRERKFICDDCGSPLDPSNFKINAETMEDHIRHLINPLFYWSCEDCLQSDLKNGRVLATSVEKNTDWQIRNK